jgi:hypothetical protein
VGKQKEIAMKLLEQYIKAMREDVLFICMGIEDDNGLYGLPPELVTVGLKAIDEGRDAWEEIDRYTTASDQH